MFWDVLSGLIKLAMIRRHIEPKGKENDQSFFANDEIFNSEENHEETEEQKMEK